MSRTKRRKKAVVPKWVTHKGSYHKRPTNCGIYRIGIYIEVPLEGKELKKSIASYQGDNDRGEYSAPAWFVKYFFTKKYRSKERKELNRILKSGNYEDYTFNPFRRAAMWEWY